MNQLFVKKTQCIRVVNILALFIVLVLGTLPTYAAHSMFFDVSPGAFKPKDRDPMFPGGEKALKSFIDSTLQYPSTLVSENLTGVVYALVLIDESGFISFKHLLDPVHPLFAAEALRVVDAMPRWKPALKEWKPIPALRIIPFVFAPKGCIKPEVRKIYLLTEVDEKPEFECNGMDLTSYIINNQNYPHDSILKVCSGEIRITCIINTHGQVEMVQLLSGIGELCDNRAIKMVKDMPTWRTGRLKRENVNVMLNLPIIFEPHDSIKAKYFVADLLKHNTSRYQTDTDTSFSRNDTTKNAQDNIFTVVEGMPEFYGGDEARLNYLATNMHYPAEARENGIQGTVYITFVIETDGSITNIRLLNWIGGGLAEEALRVVKEMPKWKPAVQRGKAVRVQFNMPIKFTLAQ